MHTWITTLITSLLLGTTTALTGVSASAEIPKIQLGEKYKTTHTIPWHKNQKSRTVTLQEQVNGKWVQRQQKSTKSKTLFFDVKPSTVGTKRFRVIAAKTALSAKYEKGFSLVVEKKATPTPPPVVEPPVVEPPVTDPPVVEPPTVDTCQAPAYKDNGTPLFGASLSSSDGSVNEATAKNDGLFGKMPIVRQFDPTVPPNGAWSRRTALRDRAVIHSFRTDPKAVVAGTHDAAILAFYKEAPSDHPVFYSYYHEPEPEINSGKFTYAEYRAAWQHIVELVGTLCKPNLYPTLILTGWTTEPASKRDWRDYYPGDEYISVMAFDPYNSATGQATTYKDPATLYASTVKVGEESGKPWGIAETGSNLIAGDSTGVGRAAWLKKVGQYFTDQGAVFVTYFQSTNNGNFKLLDEPSVTAWKKWVQTRS